MEHAKKRRKIYVEMSTGKQQRPVKMLTKARGGEITEANCQKQTSSGTYKGF